MNVTTVNTLTTGIFYKTQANWIIPMVLIIILLIASLWVLISFTFYGFKNEKWKNSRRNNQERINAGSTYVFAIFFIACCLFRYVTSAVAINIGYGENLHVLCRAIDGIAYALYILVLYSVVLFLWLRQRVLFLNEMLRASYNTIIKSLSFLSIFLITAAWIAILAFHLVQTTFVSSINGGCETKEHNFETSRIIAIVIAIVVFHFLLLGLFAYALLRIKRPKSHVKVKNSSEGNSSSDTNNSNTMNSRPRTYTSMSMASLNTIHNLGTLRDDSRSRNTSAITTLLMKTLILAVIIIITDILTHTFVFYVISSKDYSLVQMVYDINTFFNLLFLIFSFDSYKEILTSPLKNSTSQSINS